MSGLSSIIAGAGNQSGELTKLRIDAFPDPEQSGTAASTFEAYYNPASFQASYALKYDETDPKGATKREMRYNGYEATTYAFELLLDGTGGSIPNKYKDAPKSVADMVAEFLKVAYGFEGSTHRGNYLMLVWGKTAAARCVLVSSNITYDLFKPSGDPLRAKISCSFKEYSYEELRKAGEKSGSPDMTHVRIVKQGDRLPLMCERIYGDATLYLEVARYNGFTNYRNLEPGTQVLFPPLVSAKS
ncbi:MAG: hypothetical protein IPN95_25855 [Bacteroidetes bacterium]|jgi:nucleoid-associated protein YgaU|nr:hypothetical protein [Bacteroidota bacterium]MBL0019359.1 hypothetical protein [Bacteroidota bacterium]MBP6639259.1 hypothetical protein [Bacteroidia bacterium]